MYSVDSSMSIFQQFEATKITTDPNRGEQIIFYGIFMLIATLYVTLYQFRQMVAGYYRNRFFNKEFMEQFRSDFDGNDPPLDGFPDDGNGPFSDALSYKEWFIFNKAQRVQFNMFESITCIVFLASVGFLAFPKVAAIFFLMVFLGRLQF